MWYDTDMNLIPELASYLIASQLFIYAERNNLGILYLKSHTNYRSNQPPYFKKYSLIGKTVSQPPTFNYQGHPWYYTGEVDSNMEKQIALNHELELMWKRDVYTDELHTDHNDDNHSTLRSFA